MGDSASQEQLHHRLEEGLVAPNMIRPAMEIKIIKPDDGKGMVPPSLVQLPVPAPSSLEAQTLTPSVPGLVPSNSAPPVQSKPPAQGQVPQSGNHPTK